MNIQEIQERFSVISKLALDTCKGIHRGLIISGPPGIGKSYEINKAVKKASRIQNFGIYNEKDTIFVKGKITAAGLYEILKDNSGPEKVIILDDCDSVIDDEDGLNVLKAALDTSSTRTISWVTSSSKTSKKSFVFEGSLIFITNIDFEKEIVSKHKNAVHLAAMMDRCLYVSVGIRSLEEQFIRIEYVSKNFMAENLELSDEKINELLQFVKDNISNFRSVSLRLIVQLANIMRSNNDWQMFAKISLFKSY